MRGPRGSRATRVVGSVAPPPEPGRAEKLCFSFDIMLKTELVRYETHLYHVSEEVRTTSPHEVLDRPGVSTPLPKRATQAVRGPDPPGQ